jgi:lipoprotein-releasing system ATP-binding protein
MDMTKIILELNDIHHHYKQGGEDLHILKGINFSVKAGETIAMLGQSGAGKSTFLHIAGLLEKASKGEVMIDGISCNSLSDIERTKIRRFKIGFVYQFHHLLPEFTAIENISIPQMVAGVSQKAAHKRSVELLEKMGLSDRMSHRPSQLSGGEQQRVAIARALANHPAILLADEPTGNLDEKTGGAVLDELLKISKEENIAALFVTHNRSLASRMDKCFELKNGDINI